MKNVRKNYSRHRCQFQTTIYRKTNKRRGRFNRSFFRCAEFAASKNPLNDRNFWQNPSSKPEWKITWDANTNTLILDCHSTPLDSLVFLMAELITSTRKFHQVQRVKLQTSLSSVQEIMNPIIFHDKCSFEDLRVYGKSSLGLIFGIFNPLFMLEDNFPGRNRNPEPLTWVGETLCKDKPPSAQLIQKAQKALEEERQEGVSIHKVLAQNLRENGYSLKPEPRYLIVIKIRKSKYRDPDLIGSYIALYNQLVDAVESLSGVESLSDRETVRLLIEDQASRDDRNFGIGIFGDGPEWLGPEEYKQYLGLQRSWIELFWGPYRIEPASVLPLVRAVAGKRGIVKLHWGSFPTFPVTKQNTWHPNYRYIEPMDSENISADLSKAEKPMDPRALNYELHRAVHEMIGSPEEKRKQSLASLPLRTIYREILALSSVFEELVAIDPSVSTTTTLESWQLGEFFPVQLSAREGALHFYSELASRLRERGITDISTIRRIKKRIWNELKNDPLRPEAGIFLVGSMFWLSQKFTIDELKESESEDWLEWHLYPWYNFNNHYFYLIRFFAQKEETWEEAYAKQIERDQENYPQLKTYSPARMLELTNVAMWHFLSWHLEERNPLVEKVTQNPDFWTQFAKIPNQHYRALLLDSPFAYTSPSGKRYPCYSSYLLDVDRWMQIVDQVI